MAFNHDCVDIANHDRDNLPHRTTPAITDGGGAQGVEMGLENVAGVDLERLSPDEAAEIKASLDRLIKQVQRATAEPLLARIDRLEAEIDDLASDRAALVANIIDWALDGADRTNRTELRTLRGNLQSALDTIDAAVASLSAPDDGPLETADPQHELVNGSAIDDVGAP